MTKPPPSAPFSMSGPPPSGRGARTFHPRRGRLSTTEALATQDLVPRYSYDVRSEKALIGENVIIDVGFGNGETTLALGRSYPDRIVYGIDIHTPGLAQLAIGIDLEALDNVRIVNADALDVLNFAVSPAQASIINVSFPDPWKKPGQFHRRIVNLEFADLVNRCLVPGGVFTFATDWAPYCSDVEKLFAAHPKFQPSEIWLDRPHTKFEARAFRDQRVCTDLAYKTV